MGAGAIAKVGLGAVKSIFSPVGLCIVSVLLIILINFNPIFLVFDLMIKTMNILSGNALIQQAINGTFDPSSPIFIVYITVFLVTFILLVFKVVKSSLSDMAISNDLKHNEQKATFSVTKMKWVLIWLVSFLTLPFVCGIIMYLITLLANLFSLTPLSINSIFTFTTQDWINSVQSMQSTITNQIEAIENIVNLFFPDNIDGLTENDIPFWVINNGVTLEQWKTFLNGLSANDDATKFYQQINLLLTKLTILKEADIFKVNVDSITNIPVSTTTAYINSFATQLNEINNLISQNNLNISSLELAINNVSNSLNNAFSIDIIVTLNNELIEASDVIKKVPVNLISTFNSSSLSGIAAVGIDGQITDNYNTTFKPEKVTQQIASVIYQKNVYNWTMSLTGSYNNSISNIPIVGQFLSSFMAFFRNIGYMFSNPIGVVELFISTFAFAYCFTTFWSITLMFAGKLFDFLSMIIIAPFTAVSGIADNGEKFQVWLKTFLGKALIVFIVSLSISIFIVAVNVFGEFVNSTKFIQEVGTWAILISKFLIMVLIIATCSGLLEFVGWAAQILNFDQRMQKYRNNFTNKKMNLMQNVQSGYNDYQNSAAQKAKLNLTNQQIMESKEKTAAYSRFKNGYNADITDMKIK